MATAHVEADWRADFELVAPAAPWLVEGAAGTGLSFSAVAVPWRYNERGGFEVALVKRRRRGDWGFPKGSPLPGEALSDAAGRELKEETGHRGRDQAPLANLLYTARSGRAKLASYWLMRVGAGAFRPNREIAKLSWLSPREATAALSNERERLVLRLATEALGLGLLAG